MRDINKADRPLAQRLFSCISVAHRPLRANELARLLRFNVWEGPFRLFRKGWRQEDLVDVDAVTSTYSNFFAIVDNGGSPVVQFLHSSVQEFLEDDRLAQASGEISCYHVSRATAHTLVAQVCLDVLLGLDWKLITRDSLPGFPLAEYASEHWVNHAWFGNVSQDVEDRVKHLFDPRKPHLSVCLWIHNPEVPRWMQPKRVEWPSPDLPLTGTPLHYATLGITYYCRVPGHRALTGYYLDGFHQLGDSVTSCNGKRTCRNCSPPCRVRLGYRSPGQGQLNSTTSGVAIASSSTIVQM